MSISALDVFPFLFWTCHSLDTLARRKYLGPSVLANFRPFISKILEKALSSPASRLSKKCWHFWKSSSLVLSLSTVPKRLFFKKFLKFVTMFSLPLIQATVPFLIPHHSPVLCGRKRHCSKMSHVCLIENSQFSSVGPTGLRSGPPIVFRLYAMPGVDF